MTQALLLDTHIALWLVDGSDRLRLRTRDRIDACWRDNGRVLISAVTLWEIGQLVDAGRIDIGRPSDVWLDQVGARAGIVVLPLSPHAAARAYRLRDLAHRDPADRLLIATAIEQACPLVTYDTRITRFAVVHGSQYGFSATD